MKINFCHFIHTVTKEQLDHLINNLKGENDPDLKELVKILEKVN